MASLADEFLMDMESSEDEEEQDLENPYLQDAPNPAGGGSYLDSLAKSKKKFFEPAPENITIDEEELKELEAEEGIDLAFLNKIRMARTDKEGSAKSLASARRASKEDDHENEMMNDSGMKRPGQSSDSEIDSEDELDINGRPRRKRRKGANTLEEIEYEKLEKRIRREQELETFERMKQSNELLTDPLTVLRECQPGPSCLIPDKNEQAEAYEAYVLKKDKKKIRFVLPEQQKSVYDYANLKLTPHYNNILTKLDNTRLEDESHASEETYNLIIDANALLSDVDFEMIKIYNFVRDIYTNRFPEMETLLTNKVEYLKVAGILLNELMNAKAMLTDKISDAQVMIVAMTATNTQGKKLPGEKIETVKEACQLADTLARDRSKIVKFVKSRMSLLAPNVTSIIGPNVAAQLIGKAADGLQGLARMPGCNILLLGQERNPQQFSAHNKMPHTGYIFYSPLVQSIHPDFRRKASRQVANKVTLAARADANLTSRERRMEPELGYRFRDEIYKKFELWEEPAKVKDVKALPKPLEQAGKKRRGGKRYRKMKERLGMTEVRKQANRTTFGEIEEDLNQEDLGISLGHLNQQAGSGLIRNLVEEKKSKVRLSKKMTTLLQKEAAASGVRTAISSGFRTVHKELGGGKSTVLGWGGTMTSMGKRSSFRKGSASSVTFTPVQGLEIVNPEATAGENDDGISSTASYFAQPTLFKMPALPEDPAEKAPRGSVIPGSASSIPGSMRRNANGSVIPRW